MTAEIVACALGALVLIAVGVMEAIGVMGIVGAVRFRACPKCSHWTLRGSSAQAICGRCRRSEARAEHPGASRGAGIARLRAHLLHPGH